MNIKNILYRKLVEGTAPTELSMPSSQEVAELKTQMLEMQMEIGILKETINVLKKNTTLIKWFSVTERG